MNYVLPETSARRSLHEIIPGQIMMSIDAFIGDNVYNPKGERLGNIQDIVLDIQSNKLRYAIVSSGGFLGMGRRLLAVPWNALDLDPDNGKILLNLEATQISNAPGFDRNHWPNMSDSAWAASIHSYYGTSQD